MISCTTYGKFIICTTIANSTPENKDTTKLILKSIVPSNHGETDETCSPSEKKPKRCTSSKALNGYKNLIKWLNINTTCTHR